MVHPKEIINIADGCEGVTVIGKAVLRMSTFELCKYYNTNLEGAHWYIYIYIYIYVCEYVFVCVHTQLHVCAMCIPFMSVFYLQLDSLQACTPCIVYALKK